MFVAGVDGCRAGWIAFKVEVPSLVGSVEVIDLPALLTNPSDLACLGIDIPIGLLGSERDQRKYDLSLLRLAARAARSSHLGPLELTLAFGSQDCHTPSLPLPWRKLLRPLCPHGRQRCDIGRRVG